jgi:N-acetylglucosaminyldiphosphoundecaprenol N-acetyl-beta-D-mannosaminyltransferase
MTHAAIQTGLQSASEIDCQPVDQLTRNAYCVLGIPIDATDIAAALVQIECAAARATPFMISTANLNFLVTSRFDAEFRESLLDSDFCLADGMPVVWIARLMGVPIKKRVSGSDIFEALKSPGQQRHLSVCFFGGEEGIAAKACSALNRQSGGLTCVGAVDPGVGTIDEMSSDELLHRVNKTGADFLAVALGAQKGQLWLKRNHDRITIPVRAHLGAVVNFEAGTVTRAPATWRRWGLEWLWRIKEEPHLWRRYWHDGGVLLRLFCTRVLPLAVANRVYWLKSRFRPGGLEVKLAEDEKSITISLAGEATEQHVHPAIHAFQETLRRKITRVSLDLAGTRVIDQRFLGLLMMLRKAVIRQGARLTFIGVSSGMRRMFRLNEAEYLLD